MWEYKTHCFEFVFMRNGKLINSIPNVDPRISPKETEIEPWLNEMGGEGWELIFMDSSMKKYIFKRKLTAKIEKFVKTEEALSSCTKQADRN